jgi:hypothetical protein
MALGRGHGSRSSDQSARTRADSDTNARADSFGDAYNRPFSVGDSEHKSDANSRSVADTIGVNTTKPHTLCFPDTIRDRDADAIAQTDGDQNRSTAAPAGGHRDRVSEPDKHTDHAAKTRAVDNSTCAGAIHQLDSASYHYPWATL